MFTTKFSGKAWGLLAATVFAGLVLLSCSSSGSTTNASSTSPVAASPPDCGESVPTVETAQGSVCGVTREHDGESANAYLGIPFAEPPVGDLRWRNPEPPEDHSGVLKATAYGDPCVQVGSNAQEMVDSEDCLDLNIFSPQGAKAGSLPVMVWIPGGGFVVGSGSEPAFDGSYMAGSGDVVVVTLNYRLAAVGFVRYLEHDSDIEGNFGIADQVAAIKWVKENIATFGGDPSKVTVFGESAGAQSTGLHLFSIPASDDLFRAAVMESNVLSVPYADPDTGASGGKAFVSRLCSVAGETDCARDAQWLRGLPVHDQLRDRPEQHLGQVPQGKCWATLPGQFRAISGRPTGPTPQVVQARWSYSTPGRGSGSLEEALES